MTKIAVATRHDRARNFAWLLLLSAAAFVVPVLSAANANALGVARGDDWSYLRTLFSWVNDGTLNFNHWVSMSLLGHLALGAPFAAARPGSIAPLQILVAVVGLVGVLAVYRLGRFIAPRRHLGGLLALTLAIGPFYGVLATGYMTDVTGFAFAALTTAAAIVALSAATTRAWHRATLVLGLFAFTIREYAALPLLAYLVVEWWRSRADGDQERARALLRTGIVCIAGMVVFMVLWRQIPDGKAFSPSFPTQHSIENLYYKGSGFPRLLGLWLFPLLIALGPLGIVRRAWRASADTSVFTALGVIVTLGYSGINAPRIAFAGNYFVPDGALSTGVSAGGRPDIIGPNLFGVLIAIGTLGAALLALCLIPPSVTMLQRLRSRSLTIADPVIAFSALALIAYTGIYIVVAATGLPLYDRYTLPMALPAGILLIRTAAKRTAPQRSTRRTVQMVSIIAATTALSVLSGLYTVDSASFDAARWRVSEDAVKQGWSPRQIGGNFEWANYYGTDPGTGIRARTRFCVKVFVGSPPESAAAVREIARRMYRPPLHDAVPVVAMLMYDPCPN